jgi:hypothetical protein
VGCALHLTREQESLQKVCESVTVESLNARDQAIKADNHRELEGLQRRMDSIEASDRSIDRRLDELLQLAHSRYYGWRTH